VRITFAAFAVVLPVLVAGDGEQAGAQISCRTEIRHDSDTSAEKGLSVPLPGDRDRRAEQ
jgi:hypothetical protein